MTAKKLTDDQRRRIYCVKHGHSRLRDYCFGYHHCARCGQMLGDSLGGAYSDDSAVYVSHVHAFTHEKKRARDCRCPENAKKLRKSDFVLVPQWNAWGEEQRPPWRKKPRREVQEAVRT